MAFVRTCPKCGSDLSAATSPACPGCGAPILPTTTLGVGKWIAAATQIGLTTIFMLVFGFPKIMILVFAGLILLFTALSSWIKPAAAAARTAPQRPGSNPVMFKILGLASTVCVVALVGILLFGFVIFMNSWNRWHQYEGQRHQHSDFQVVRVYYQPHTKGGADVYASGMVDGEKEWMGLLPYLHIAPRNQAELDARVPVGTIIPVYVYPDLKGRARVQVYSPIPPDEASKHTAMSTLNYGLLGLAITAGMIFVLSRLRQACFDDSALPLSATQPEIPMGKIG
jgi:hypothetical protein